MLLLLLPTRQLLHVGGSLGEQGGGNGLGGRRQGGLQIQQAESQILAIVRHARNVY